MTTATGSTQTFARDRRAELLAASPANALAELAEACLALVGEPVITRRPETGIVVLQVREPIETTRFNLGEVVTTQAEVEIDTHRGWSMRPGTDRMATLAAAIADAAAEASESARQLVDDLCRYTADTQRSDEAHTSRILSRTVVDFEELD